jgi:hypothetical protein
MPQESTPSLYGCGATLKDNASECKLGALLQANKHLIKQMVLVDINTSIPSIAAGIRRSANIGKKYPAIAPLSYL